MSRWVWSSIAIPFLSGGIGLLFANMISAQRGAEHSCPAGAPRSACFYAPDQTSWDVAWTVSGLVVGIILGASYWASHRARAKGKLPLM